MAFLHNRWWPVALLSGGLAVPAFATDGKPATSADGRGMPAHCALHSDAQKLPVRSRYERSVGHYKLPQVRLVDQDGKQIDLADAVPADELVAVNFIFTTCTTICPVMSATFRGLNDKLGAAASSLRMVSISIDPEHDRPEVLKAYARKFHAGANWRFYTGTTPDIRQVLAAFDAFNGDKANHRPIMLLRRAHGEEWIRIEGFPTAAELASESHALLATR